MKAVDTNVLARYITGDDPAQAEQATALLAQPFFVADTVFLETAWLLSSYYRLDRATLAATLRDLLSLPTIAVRDHDGLLWTVDRFAAGADLADMIHLVASAGLDAFVSFEKHLAKGAGPDTPIAVERLT